MRLLKQIGTKLGVRSLAPKRRLANSASTSQTLPKSELKQPILESSDLIGELVVEFDQVISEAAQYGPSEKLESRFQAIRATLLENRANVIASNSDSDRMARLLGARNLNVATRHAPSVRQKAIVAQDTPQSEKPEKAATSK